MNHLEQHQLQQTRTSGYTEPVPIGCAERPIPGLGLYHGDCRESHDVADVWQYMVHQVHLHAASTTYTARSTCVY